MIDKVQIYMLSLKDRDVKQPERVCSIKLECIVFRPIACCYTHRLNSNPNMVSEKGLKL